MPQQRASAKDGPAKRRPRKSAHVRLLVLGTLTLGACGAPQDPVASSRYVYGMYTDCVHDWGEQNCRDHSAPSSGYGHYYGPYYGSYINLPSGQSVYAGTKERPVIHTATGETLGAKALSVSRGGFGSFARSFGIGG
jgi:hypothetical protein